MESSERSEAARSDPQLKSRSVDGYYPGVSLAQPVSFTSDSDIHILIVLEPVSLVGVFCLNPGVRFGDDRRL